MFWGRDSKRVSSSKARIAREAGGSDVDCRNDSLSRTKTYSCPFICSVAGESAGRGASSFVGGVWKGGVNPLHSQVKHSAPKNGPKMARFWPLGQIWPNLKILPFKWRESTRQNDLKDSFWPQLAQCRPVPKMAIFRPFSAYVCIARVVNNCEI